MALQRLATRLLALPSPSLVQTAGLTRGPPRFLDRTKSQYLDILMRSNATICAAISFSFFPIVAYYVWRYN